MTHRLPKLPYDYDALEPHIDARTMEIHFTKHHQGYVSNLNKALEGHDDLASRSALQLLSELDSLPEAIRTAVRNNAGGHVNHTMFWPAMSSEGGGVPDGILGDAIATAFGSYASFQEQFNQAATGRFGSGWAWLTVDPEGTLAVMSTPNQDNPISDGLIPILGIDVWEHAYYLKYQNRRAEYVTAWWNVVNWDEVARQYTLVEIGKGLNHAKQWVESAWAKLEEILGTAD